MNGAEMPCRTLVGCAALLVVSLCLHLGCGGATPASPAAARTSSTLDSRVQQVVREELDQAVAQWRPEAGLAVVIDPVSGNVLAIQGREGTRDEPWLARDRAYVTGSTLKPLTIAAAIDQAAIDPDGRVDCRPRSYGADTLSDANAGACKGEFPLADEIMVSSNVGTARVFDTLGPERLAWWLRRIHVGDPPGQLPTIADRSSVQAAAFGIGALAKATALQMVGAYAAVFNGGEYVAPTFTVNIPRRQRVLQSQTAARIVSMLEQAVASDAGTGKLGRVSGMRVAGKTGTADIEGEKTYASFVGTVLDREPRFVALIGLVAPREGATGASAAAPTFARMAARIVVPKR